ncbi:MAG: 3-oxoacyl-ACP reductase FabG [Kiritimatiellae bacterium]|nr:3-oxoacyl-ACP reductase FabG [Kiritimatiellia bacterium]MDD5521005.1 3-oxoacyl-ACP reductase FabG [Kiritimatiellia bacterium]
MIPINLSGKIAIVTGAGQGLGATTAVLLAKAGAAVAINYFNDPQGLNRRRAEETAGSIGKMAILAEANVCDPAAVTRMFDAVITRFGHVDIVINNAGILRDRTIKKMSEEEWTAVIETNLTGVFHMCREAALKLADGGRIVNLASISGVLGLFGQANYAASKAGVIGLTKVLSKELAKRRITVNAVAPGVVLTEMGKSIPEEVRVEMLKNVPLGRFGEPEEIGGVILFLCSELASYVTSQVIQVNGGWIG